MSESHAQGVGLKIVADENIPALEQYFGDLGTLVRYPGRTLTREQLIDADILLVRSVTRVNQSLLEGTPVRFVGSCTIGTDHLDTDWMERNGIYWSAAPGCNANSVVEYVFCALAALKVDWRGRSFGIVGCGNVGGCCKSVCTHWAPAALSMTPGCQITPTLLLWSKYWARTLCACTRL